MVWLVGVIAAPTPALWNVSDDISGRGRGVRGRRGAEDGAAAVEFALVSVLLFTLLFGILQYGYYFYQLNSANAASREAARLAATGVSDCTAFRAAVNNRATGIKLTSITTSVTTAPAASPQDGDIVNVTIVFAPTKFGFPFVPFIGSATQSQVGKARIESPGSVIACP
jgi:Flp pilus assembly protein TadG